MVTERVDPSCDFCAIATGTDPDAEVICEGETWIAFFPLNPATPGHTLIIPRTHVRDLWELDLALGSDLMAAVLKVGHSIQTAINPEGMNLITSAGRTAEQSIFHLHLHIVPRWQKDGFGEIWPPGNRYEDSDLEDVADRIRRACSSEHGD